MAVWQERGGENGPEGPSNHCYSSEGAAWQERGGGNGPEGEMASLFFLGGGTRHERGGYNGPGGNGSIVLPQTMGWGREPPSVVMQHGGGIVDFQFGD